MIAVSGLLVLVAFVTLVVGIFREGLDLIYVSIGASVLAAISLATGVVKARPKAVAVGPEPLGTWGSTPAAPVTPVEEAPEPVTSVLTLEEPAEPVLEAEEASGAIVPAPAPPPARKAPARKAPAKAPAKKAAARAPGTVVVIPGRDKFHKESCRYAKGEATQTITKAAARKEGYVPCGVCKP